jgi:hypothetical protein
MVVHGAAPGRFRAERVEKTDTASEKNLFYGEWTKPFPGEMQNGRLQEIDDDR